MSDSSLPTPPPPPLAQPPTPRSKKNGLAGGIIIAAVVIGVATVVQRGLTHMPSSPVSTPGSGVTLNVVSCEVSSGYATAKVSLTSTQAYSFVSLSGDFTSGGGTVIGQGIGSLSDVQPGQSYETTVIYTLSGDGQGGTCGVHVESAL